MRTMAITMVLAAFSLLAGCVVVPAHAYVVRPRVVAVAPAPVVVVRPHYYYYRRW